MEDTGRFGRLWPIRCEVVGNAYLDNDRGDRTIWSRVADEARAKSRIDGERRLSPEQFVDYDSLDLRFRDGAGDVPAIPFASIGLALDEHRHRMPDVVAFRRALREAFRGIGSMPGTRKRVDTAAMVEAVPVRTAATSRTPRPRRDG